MAPIRSPFPGMDPYLEQHWRDVHHSLCTYARDALQPQLRPRFLARLEERLIVETESDDSRSIYPDVKIIERRPNRRPPRETGGGVAVAEPLRIRGEIEPVYEGFIQIIDGSTGKQLVTVIEILSPSNKFPGPNQKAYRQKQQELAEAKISLVEIDLLRDGDWMVQSRRDRVPPSHYRVSVHRGWMEDECEYYPIYLHEPLPAFKIPLRQEDADVRLDLQAILDQTYINGAYDAINYRLDPVPPLSAKDAEWANALLRRADLR